jgi:hypothetical protein
MQNHSAAVQIGSAAAKSFCVVAEWFCEAAKWFCARAEPSRGEARRDVERFSVECSTLVKTVGAGTSPRPAQVS